MTKVYVLIHDKDKTIPPITRYELDEQYFRSMNKQGWGVYFAVNDFEATPEQMKERGVRTKRNECFVTKLNAVFADLDIAKAGDGKTREEKERAKLSILEALESKCYPTSIIITSNGCQPIWSISDGVVNDENIRKYKKVIKGIIKWSKKHGSAGDPVKDIPRVLRFPGYYHMKEKPFMVEVEKRPDTIYTLDELLGIFPYEEEEVVPYKPVKEADKNDMFREVERIDIKELIQKAASSVGRRVEYDKKGRMIMDGRLSGNFIGKNDDGYIASTSHEDWSGNRVTAVSKILGVNNTEAYKWICEEYNITMHEAKRKNFKVKDRVEKKEKKEFVPFTWGTDVLDDRFSPLKKSQSIIVAAGTGMGKTTYCFHVAKRNAEMGHNVLYLTLEMTEFEIKERMAREFAGITIREDRLEKYDPHKKVKYERKMEELDSYKNLKITGFPGGDRTIEDVLAYSEALGDWDLIFLDNLGNMVPHAKQGSETEKENYISEYIKNYVKEKEVPIILVHHTNKTQNETGLSSLRGSAKITDNADGAIVLSRSREPEGEKERCAMNIKLLKSRRGGFASAVIYFRNASFTDDFDELSEIDRALGFS